MVLPLPPDGALVVDNTRGLYGGDDVMEQANPVLVKTASCASQHGEEGNMKGSVCSYVLTVLIISIAR